MCGTLKIVILTRSQMRYSQTLPADGGHFAPPPILQTPPILDQKAAFDSSGLELSEYVAKYYLNVTDDVTSRVKGQIFFICH